MEYSHPLSGYVGLQRAEYEVCALVAAGRYSGTRKTRRVVIWR